ncbi:hypothetical protein ON021_03390, partial [Microcoleus sp. HI-ES]|nr:hypothetical protein [Microcoleus sp. HI-ES]
QEGDRTNLHPLPLKPRKPRPQCDQIGICGFAQYDLALRHFRFEILGFRLGMTDDYRRNVKIKA